MASDTPSSTIPAPFAATAAVACSRSASRASISAFCRMRSSFSSSWMVAMSSAMAAIFLCHPSMLSSDTILCFSFLPLCFMICLISARFEGSRKVTALPSFPALAVLLLHVLLGGSFRVGLAILRLLQRLCLHQLRVRLCLRLDHPLQLPYLLLQLYTPLPLAQLLQSSMRIRTRARTGLAAAHTSPRPVCPPSAPTSAPYIGHLPYLGHLPYMGAGGPRPHA